MKQLLLLLLSLSLCVACSDSGIDIEPETTTETDTLRRVVIVYIMAENSLTSYASSDMAEIRKAYGSIPKDCEMVVYLDNSSEANMPYIAAFNSEGETVVRQYDYDPVSTDSAEMQSTLAYIMEQRPAEEYALILWSHGSGWVPATRTIGIDNSSNTSSDYGLEMEITTLRHVLENTGVRWKYVMYDACFMQCIEVAYELRNATEWSIGSPAEIPGDGAPYDELMESFFAEETFAKDIALGYYTAYTSNKTHGAVMSSVRSDRLEALAAATVKALAEVEDFATTDVQQYGSYTSRFTEYYDMGGLINAWCAEDVYAEWLEALDEAVPYRYTKAWWYSNVPSGHRRYIDDASLYSGLSMYVPVASRESLNASWRSCDWYAAAGYALEQ